MMPLANSGSAAGSGTTSGASHGWKSLPQATCVLANSKAAKVVDMTTVSKAAPLVMNILTKSCPFEVGAWNKSLPVKLPTKVRPL